MTELDHLKADLDFVQTAVQRGRNDLGAAPIYYLWAILIAIGFSLPDFAPRAALPFWMVAGISGGLLSVWLAHRYGNRIGVHDAKTGWRQGMHWLASGIAIGIAMLTIATGKVASETGAPLLLALVGQAYLLAGIHIHPPLRWSGAVMLASAAALVWLRIPYLWTGIGLAVAMALAAGGFAAQRAARH